jgi:hypothetical protein
MTAFDLTKFNNINWVLRFKLYNQPTFDYQEDKNIFYTTLRLARYYKTAEQPALYGPDEVVITYTYWHNENGYDECKQDENECNAIVVLGHEYDKDIIPNWHDAASYHKYDYDSYSDDER